MEKKPELLLPAGSLKAMRYALAYGADAVYGGLPRYSLRVRNNEFNISNLGLGIEQAHNQGKKFYVVVNILAHNSKIKTLIADLKPVIELKPDALIISDPGIVMLVREEFPEMDVHLSVQANTVNWASAEFWRRQGVKRIILSRELSLDEISDIQKKVPQLELEVFVHGSLCMAYSGRCLLAGYLNRRDPNQGVCTNVCRWQFSVEKGQEDECGSIVRSTEADKPQVGLGESCDSTYILEEAERPREYMPIFEDEHGTYILNSRDLRALEHVKALCDMGISSLKIEGRTKSYYYCARTAKIYRQAIDDAVAGRPLDESLFRQLDGLANRGYTSGFLSRQPHSAYQNYDFSNSDSFLQRFVGEFTGQKKGDLAEIIVKNRFAPGDNLSFISPSGESSFDLKQVFDKKLNHMPAAPGDGHVVYVPLPEGHQFDLEYALLVSNLPQDQP